MQATQNSLLKQIGRIHTYEQFIETYKNARGAGFENINVDLMIGLPEQKKIDVQESLKSILDLKPEHVSVYSLILEEGTTLYKMVQNGEIKLLDEERERQQYWTVKNTLEEYGYKHYEISNFAKDGYESKHNMNCWEQKEYLGFGYSAHSYFNKVRYSNTNANNLQEYIVNCNNKDFEKNIEINEKQNIEDMQKEYMLLGLRKIDGVSIQKFKNKFIQNPIYIFSKELSKLSKDNLIEIDEDNIKLTTRGLDLANLVWEEFV